MPIAQIIDMSGAGVPEYEQAFALIHPGGCWPAGQLSHIAGPTPDGFRVIDVWESREACARAFEERIHPAVDRAFGGSRPAGEPEVHPLEVVDLRGSLVPQGPGR